ncbi:hypothetical protein [Philodulcilactobacillus myokoensis]|uniref:hypothetical protein n=1 Tax=Philodulcilactobacillus myokoensis TaxID=2929573 RepID=UPI0025708053|nr:hypothetical protein [Philodulcilactobacillus myokoensis]
MADSMVGLSLITTGMIFYFQFNSTINRSLYRQNQMVIQSRKTYENQIQNRFK